MLSWKRDEDGYNAHAHGWTLEVWEECGIWNWQAIAGTYEEQAALKPTEASGLGFDTIEEAMAAATVWLLAQVQWNTAYTADIELDGNDYTIKVEQDQDGTWNWETTCICTPEDYMVADGYKEVTCELAKHSALTAAHKDNEEK